MTLNTEADPRKTEGPMRGPVVLGRVGANRSRDRSQRKSRPDQRTSCGVRLFCITARADADERV
jgi:hypothetical protein